MKSLRSISLATAAFACIGAAVRVESAPYLETAPVSILWNFTVTGATGVTLGPVPVVPGLDAPLDPEKLRPTDRITTDVGTPIVYPVENGNQSFFVKQVIRSLQERDAEAYKELAEERDAALAPTKKLVTEAEAEIVAITAALAGTTDPDERGELIAARDTLTAAIEGYKITLASIKATYAPDLNRLQAQIKYLSDNANGSWELLSVREPSASVSELIAKPMNIFLARIERTAGGLSPNYLIGLRMVPIYSALNTVETLADGRVTKATGSVTTHFSLTFTQFYANDPLYLVDPDSRAAAVEGEAYNKAGNRWVIFGTGYMTYNIRSTPGPLAAVAPTKIKITGHGSWYNNTGEGTFGGVAPLSIKMGEVKYQNRNMFPDFEAVE